MICFAAAKHATTYLTNPTVTKASPMSVSNLLAPGPDSQTVLDEATVRYEDASRPRTPPVYETSWSANAKCRQRDHQSDAEPRPLLSPAKLASSGESTFEDMLSVLKLQSSAVTSSSLALQQQMFDGYGSRGFPYHSAQMWPICCCNPSIRSSRDQQLLDVPSLGKHASVPLYPACNCCCGWHDGFAGGMRKPRGDGTSAGCSRESSYAEADFIDACLSSVTHCACATPAELLHPWTYGFGTQPIPHQDVLLGYGNDWDVAGEQLDLVVFQHPHFLNR
ncbi:hypothetical protein CORC01_13288 [Colletotrichum orchidophilum]|uniref:Uncharacterized protein n=1 Tax=Colletotrichum orchidophilum TaxID=1209926 RepID=A0A1G4AQQ6_9PEZI|nr:uncharacterized protein CORC01_13288 [Colletotrichum orchidophilum]OHE91423.1 hypothetical protein CORC01_13288 [Colletotrichum orchidophilum]